MKTRLRLLLSICAALAFGLRAQEPATLVEPPQLSAEQLDQLVGPIALYPDALVALILPASTAPADIVLAARYLKDNGDAVAVANLSWNDSVKSLTHFPDVVKWMDENLSWTKQLGEAFREQPAEVMKAIQRMRARAREAGTLANTAQQQVMFDGELITIVPAQPEVIYVPYYDPAIVYVRPSGFYGSPFLTFGAAFATGPWLAFDCDWRQRTVWTVERHWTHPGNRDWRRPVFPGQPGYVNDPNRHPWKPTNNFPRVTYTNVGRPDRGEFFTGPGLIPSHTTTTPPDRRSDGHRSDFGPNRPNLTNIPSGPPIPAPETTSTPNRRNNPPRGRPNISPDQNTNPITTAPVTTGPRNFPFGTQPTGPIVAPLSGPLVAPIMGPPAPPPSVPPPTMTFPAAAQTLPPTTPPTPPPSGDRPHGRRGDTDEQRKQPN